MRTFYFLFHCVLTFVNINAQNTVGLLSLNVEKSHDGYNLIFPHNQPNVYLLDKCGEIIHIWEDDAEFRPGNAVYLLENGNLIKCKRRNASINDPIWAGGGGETVEIRDWDNDLLHEYVLNDSIYRLHHDVAPMPNGNILMIVWERMTSSEALAAGRKPELLPQNELWSEAVLEWNPLLDSIVWTWRAQDHLIQDFDSNANNFGVISENPGRININYDEQDGHPDWLHINAIDYNPVLDQIVLSVPHFNEFWVIDHSITAEQAKGTAGDLLYRWGNPRTYDQGNESDQKLFFQHDVHWMEATAPPESPNFGRIILFNNRVNGNRSEVNIIDSGLRNASDNYKLQNGVFLPADVQSVIMHPEITILERASSSSVSSVQLLPNGNFLVFAGRWGYAYELTPTKELVWEYIVPLRGGSAVSQGEVLNINNNLTFRLNRYPLDYPAFAGRDLSPKGYMELNPNEGFCEALTPVSDLLIQEAFKFYPNPAIDQLVVEWNNQEPVMLEVFDILGRTKIKRQLQGIQNIAIAHWQPGIYWLRINGAVVQQLLVQH